MAQTILVIDDEPALRCLAEALLDELGYSVLLAESGQAALRLLRGKPHKADAVLLDLTMPGLSPEETLQGLREINPSLPVIILSAHSQTVVQGRFGTDAISGYLQKPYSDAELKTALLNALPPSTTFKIQLLTGKEKKQMATDFLAARRLELPRIAHLLGARDFDQLRIIGHTLKGSGGCFGFQQITALGAALEECAETSDIEACRRQVTLLEDCLAETTSRP